jgi:hypothetical protein
MTSSASENSDEVLRSALAGVPRVATVIVYMPPRDRERAFAAARQSYEGQRKNWVSREPLLGNGPPPSSVD